MAEDTPGTTTTTAGAVRRWGIDEARKALYDLVDAAAAGRSALIGRGTKCAVLSPLSHLDSTWQAQLSTLSATPVTTARGKLGDLLAAAASGTPQLLLHRRTPVAALPPATPEALSPSSASAARQATITSPDVAAATRRLTALDDALDEVLTPSASGHGQAVSFGIPTLDTALGGLRPGTLTLIAAAPGAGGSLFAAAAARHTALTRGLPVLYAASGLTRADIAARIIAAETPVDYRRLRTGALTAAEEQAATETRGRLAGAPLHMDDGTDLTAEVIAQTVPDITGLTLVVVDRLQYTHDPVVPLSGPELPAVTRVLAHLARTQDIPVLAVLDTDLPEVVAALDPDVTLTLTRTGEHARIDVSERDFGPQTTTQLRAELPYARFTDPADSAPAFGSVQATPASPESHRPPRSVREAATIQCPAPSGTASAPEQPHPVSAAAPARQRRVSSAKASLSTFVSDRVARALEERGGDADAALKALAGDGGSAIPDVMELFEATRVETSYQHTTYPKLPEPLVRKRRDNADEVWEARPKFTNPAVPDGTEVTELDINAAYLAALQSAHLPIRTITHNPEGWDDLANYGKGLDLSGICRIDPIDWQHPELPHPLGDDREMSGTLWVPTSVVLGLRDLASLLYGELCTPPVIREAYVAKGSASLFKTLVNVLNETRMQAVSEGDELTKTYVAAMYAKLVSTMGDSRKNHELRRPEWQHIIRGQAFSNLRRKAVRAHQAGLTVVQVGGTDELHLAGDVWAARWNGRPLFMEGRALNQIKVKRISRLGER
ncbi:DnaB helicase C-terminal domain-containing protein [Streptomyces malaysiensis]|uniref:DnaB helicase C-terminal domain-containing protein n=1 Tax=Streptomyces malaysiensis subsp. samsunensis TaxID=459658 RepID=A0A9X2M4F6_STRMQ|nr:DnaB helicase C-terminal domain-containing protein [Streptomyces samsunensis]MCQ8834833.1 DnaB helicase C-terminal domain-containing protein [Streptomyces samsunensis]